MSFFGPYWGNPIGEPYCNRYPCFNQQMIGSPFCPFHSGGYYAGGYHGYPPVVGVVNSGARRVVDRKTGQSKSGYDHRVDEGLEIERVKPDGTKETIRWNFSEDRDGSINPHEGLGKAIMEAIRSDHTKSHTITDKQSGMKFVTKALSNAQIADRPATNNNNAHNTNGGVRGLIDEAPYNTQKAATRSGFAAQYGTPKAPIADQPAFGTALKTATPQTVRPQTVRPQTAVQSGYPMECATPKPQTAARSAFATEHKTVQFATRAPSEAPSRAPSQAASRAPSHAPSQAASRAPSYAPSQAASRVPSHAPSQAASRAPSHAPSQAASRAPSHAPSYAPSQAASRAPSQAHSRAPSHAPSQAASRAPSQAPQAHATARSSASTVKPASMLKITPGSVHPSESNRSHAPSQASRAPSMASHAPTAGTTYKNRIDQLRGAPESRASGVNPHLRSEASSLRHLQTLNPNESASQVGSVAASSASRASHAGRSHVSEARSSVSHAARSNVSEARSSASRATTVRTSTRTGGGDVSREERAEQWYTQIQPIMRGQHASLQQFPDPPSGIPLDTLVGNYPGTKEELKTMRNMFHPDKFAVVPAHKVASYQERAGPIFKSAASVYASRK